MKISRWEGNEIIYTIDVNGNSVNLIEDFDFTMDILGANMVVDGMVVTEAAVPNMTVLISAGIAKDFTVGTFLIGNALVGTVTASDPILDRRDNVEIRRIVEDITLKTRQFKDPVTEGISESDINTEAEYKTEVQINAGIPGASPSAPATTAGWIKIAEISVLAASLTVVDAVIYNIDAEKSGVANTSWTSDISLTHRNGTISEMKTKIVDNETDIATNVSDISDIQDGTKQLNPRSFTSGRFDSQELVSGTLSVSGWYTIAQLDDGGNTGASVELQIIVSGGSRVGSMSVIINFNEGVSAKELPRTTIEILGQSQFGAAFVSGGIVGIRLAKSDSVSDAGALIQANLDISTTLSINVQKTKNISSLPNSEGFTLVTPYLDNTPTLPDGVTVGTFLEAGEELSLPNESVNILNFVKSSNDQLFASVIFPEIPKQGTGITLTLPITSIIIRDGTGTAVIMSTATFTTSNFGIDGKIITFRLNETGKYTTLNTGPLMATASGPGGKLTIT